MNPSLYRAIVSGNIAELKQTSSGLLLAETTNRNNTALHVAVQYGKKECVREIYGRCPSLLRQANLPGDTPLHMAARAGLFDIAKFLIECRHNDVESGGYESRHMIRMTNDEKDTALHEAVKNRCSRIVKLLTEADPTFEYSPNNAGETPLYLAAEVGSYDMVEQILKLCPSSAHSGPDGRSALHAAILLGYTGITKLLMEKKPYIIKEADDQGWTPLHCAACKGTTEIIEEIIKICPDSWELLDNRGRNFLHVAASHKQTVVVFHILTTHMLFDGLLNDPDNDGNTPLHLAVIANDSITAAFLIDDDRVNMKIANKENMTAIDILNKGDFLDLKSLKSRGVFSQRKQIIENVAKEYFSPLSKLDLKEGSGVRLVVATLILTVTFTAGITVPGGYNSEGSDEGMATLAKKAAFKAFVIFNSFAMVASTYAIFLHFQTTLTTQTAMKNFLLLVAALFTSSSITLMVLAFITGSYAVLSNSHGLAVAATVIASYFFLYTYTQKIIQYFISHGIKELVKRKYERL